MKRKYGVIIATGILWFISVLVPLFLAVLRRMPQRWLATQFLVILLLSIVLCAEWFWLRRAERQQTTAVRGEIEGAGMAALQSLGVPVILTSHSGEIVWCNDMFRSRFVPNRSVLGRSVQDVIHLNLAALGQNRDLLMEHNGLSYRVHAVPSVQNQQEFIAVQFLEITDILRLQNENTNSRPCVMLLVIDSYDDLLQYAKESEKAQVSAEVERVLENFMQGTDGVIRKVENDLFYAVMESRHLHEIMNNRFHVLDEARQIRVNDRMHITFSIGVGDGAASLAESEKFARQSLDMALGRGGDQAAVKTENGFCFFGGASKGVEKKSKTKIRSIALALQELIENSDQVFLMGHRFGDLDSIGSACGLAGAVWLMQKPAYVVVHQQSCLATQLIQRMKQCSDSPCFIEPMDALAQVTENSLLIVVDTHNKDILESLDLYHAARYVVVIDHHRKNVNFIENAVIFHHEPYASSASEMVTEIIQYFRLDTEISAAYADALLAGIMLDTKNFVMRTGVRTFEAAAYLRKIGADTIQVKTLFSNTISAYSMRSQIVSHAELYRNNAISVVKMQGQDMRVIASQAADELLSIQGVEASFVLYLEEHGVSISARSMGNVNVQVIMEQLGGGGHQTMAAAQLPKCTIQEAKEQLLLILEAQEMQKN
ncbi:DHH family phosphoesterase [Ruminococcus sp.]|uniref:DHH family phosphoesterase n=1 Tax=Ruminococcus sp. TaxID=41978 RepID=UPI0025D8F27D|nr:DHH family phosphoesterase [Ruminococcus sp.]